MYDVLIFKEDSTNKSYYTHLHSETKNEGRNAILDILDEASDIESGMGLILNRDDKNWKDYFKRFCKLGEYETDYTGTI